MLKRDKDIPDPSDDHKLPDEPLDDSPEESPDTPGAPPEKPHKGTLRSPKDSSDETSGTPEEPQD